MKWKDIKEEIERLGVKDEDEVEWIDIFKNDEIVANKNEDGNWEVSTSF